MANLSKITDGQNQLTVNNDGSFNSKLTGSNIPDSEKLPVKLVHSGGSEPLVYAGNLDGMSKQDFLLQTGSRAMAYNGTAWDRWRKESIQKSLYSAGLANTAAAVIWTPAAGKKARLMKCVVSVSVTGRYTIDDWSSGAGTGNTMNLLLTANSPVVIDFGQGWLASAADQKIRISNSSGSSSDVAVTVLGTEE